MRSGALLGGFWEPPQQQLGSRTLPEAVFERLLTKSGPPLGRPKTSNIDQQIGCFLASSLECLFDRCSMNFDFIFEAFVDQNRDQNQNRRFQVN